MIVRPSTSLEDVEPEDVEGPMRPQAYDPRDPGPDGELPPPPPEKGVQVTVELWVSVADPDRGPVQYVRQRVLRDTEDAYPDVSVLDVWMEED